MQLDAKTAEVVNLRRHLDALDHVTLPTVPIPPESKTPLEPVEQSLFERRSNVKSGYTMATPTSVHSGHPEDRIRELEVALDEQLTRCDTAEKLAAKEAEKEAAKAEKLAAKLAAKEAAKAEKLASKLSAKEAAKAEKVVEKVVEQVVEKEEDERPGTPLLVEEEYEEVEESSSVKTDPIMKGLLEEVLSEADAESLVLEVNDLKKKKTLYKSTRKLFRRWTQTNRFIPKLF